MMRVIGKTISVTIAGLAIASCAPEPPKPAAPASSAPEEGGADLALEAPPAEEPGAPLYVGLWAIDASVCSVPPGAADPSPVAISETEFIGYENLCRMGYAEEGTEGGWRIERFCNAEGVEVAEIIEVDVDPEGEGLVLRTADGTEAVLARCPMN